MKKSGLFSMMWDSYKDMHIALIGSFLLVITGDLFTLYQLYMKQKSLRELQLKQSQLYIRSIILLFAGLFLIMLLKYIGKYIQEQLRNRAQKRMRNQLIIQAARLKLPEIEHYTIQDVLRILTQDADDIVSLLLTIAFPMQILVEFLSIVIFLLSMNLHVIWILLGVSISILIITKIFQKNLNVFFDELRQKDVERSDVLYDGIRGFSTIRIYQLKKRFIDFAQKLYYICERVRIKTISIDLIQKNIIDYVFLSVLIVGIFGIFLTQGVYGRKAMAADYYVVIGYLGNLAFFLRIMPDLSQGITKAKVAYKHVQTFLAVPLDNEEVKIQEPTDSSYDMQLDDLGFTYDGSNYLFENLSISIPAGSFVTIKGESGRGKSTLLKILAGFYNPTKGEVRLGGKSLQDIPFPQVRRIISYIAQRNLVIRGTLRDNIILGHNDIPDTDIWRALREVSLDKMVDTRGQGLDLMIEEGGKNLSGGEKQRISIVRALVRNSQIILIDEGTSALDGENKNHLLSAIANLRSMRKTVVFVTHDEEIWKQGDIKIILGKI